jgi:hypothetical protein
MEVVSSHWYKENLEQTYTSRQSVSQNALQITSQTQPAILHSHSYNSDLRSCKGKKGKR